MFKSKKMKKNKMIKSTDQRNFMSCDSITCPELPEAILFEFLTRLPIKKLSQCKCVSKVWCSIIRNPEFVQAYRRRNPGAVLAISVRDKVGGVFLARQRFFYCILGVEEPQEFVNSFNLSLLDCHGVTQIVNGLVCFHGRDRVFLGNIFTREIKKLPDPPNFQNEAGKFMVSSSYYLGFDYVNGVYKLLKANSIKRISDNLGSCSFQYSYHNPSPCLTCDAYYSYEILTISIRDSDCSWRKLSDGDAYDPVLSQNRSQSSLINGILYWISDIKHGVVSFDLSTEKFCMIKPPRNVPGPRLSCIRWLGQFMGRLSLFHPSNANLIIYTLDDLETHAWTKHEVLLPSELYSNVAVPVPVPIGNLPSSDEMFLLANPNAENAFTPVYAYDHKNNSFERFVVGKWPPSALVHLRNRKEVSVLVSCVEQNIAGLDTLLCGTGTS